MLWHKGGKVQIYFSHNLIFIWCVRHLSWIWCFVCSKFIAGMCGRSDQSPAWHTVCKLVIITPKLSNVKIYWYSQRLLVLLWYWHTYICFAFMQCNNVVYIMWLNWASVYNLCGHLTSHVPVTSSPSILLHILKANYLQSSKGTLWSIRWLLTFLF